MAPFETFFNNAVRRFASIATPLVPRRVVLVASLIFFWAVNAFALTYSLFSELTTDIAVGRPAPRTIEAPKAVRIEDTERTRQERKKAADAVRTVYAVDLKAESLAQRRVKEFFDLMMAQKAERKKAEDVLVILKERGYTSFTLADVQRALSLSQAELSRVKEAAESSLQTLFLIRVKPEELQATKSRIDAVIAPVGLSSGEAQIATKLVQDCLVPNYLPDVAETQRLRNEAMAKIAPAVIQKQAGEVIVREGELIDREDYLVLKALGLTGRNTSLLRILTGVAFSGLILLLFGVFLRLFAPSVYRRTPHLIMMYVLFTVYTVLTSILQSAGVPHLVTIPLPVILANVTVGPTAAAAMLLATLAMTLFFPQNTVPSIATVVLAGTLAFGMTYTVRQQRQLLLMGTALAFVMAALTAGVAYYFQLGLGEMAREALLAAVGGFSSTVLALGLLPFLESVFRVTTPIRLLELANPNHPLLRELMQNAPGTYNHSIMTGNLAEAAAEAIGANSTLARVGGYFHDIGKLRRPLFFVENQVGGENPHDKTSPALSRLIISSHVKDGVEIAREHRLPDELVDIIAQHHGTSLIKYFYDKAVREGNGDVDEHSFRYLEERPTSREAAIVMLADSVEAAARTLSRPTPNRVEQLVKSIIRAKLDDGQLDLSNLTLRDLDKIAASFCRMLAGFYHLRVDYASEGPEIHVARRSRRGSREAHKSRRNPGAES
jgi:putative nucleotidyltransferase with HDIG domain